MTEIMNGLVSEARKNRFSSIPKLTEEDIVNVWDDVSQFISKQMKMQKGVTIPALGVFTFSQRKIDVGNNKFILVQRPVFLLSEKFAMTHGLTSSKHFTTGNIPIVQLNFAALSCESPFDRDNVESCVKEVLQALSRSIQAKRNVEFHFSGIGRLSFRDSKVKMKFYKDFLKSMDGSGSLVTALSNRPETADSVISEGFLTPRPYTSNTLVLPRIQPGISLDNAGRKQNDNSTMTPIVEEVDEHDDSKGQDGIKDVIGKVQLLLGESASEDHVHPKSPASRQSPQQEFRSRSPLSLSKATAVSYSCPEHPLGQIKTTPRKKTAESLCLEKPTISGAKLSPTDLFEFLPSAQSKPHILKESISHSDSRCHFHGERSGQELCYLCHQRAENNVPIYLNEERRRKELEQDRLLQEYQHQKDSEAIRAEQAKNLENRRYDQKVAAFNVGVAEAVKTKKNSRPTEFSRSYLFQNRALTPPRCIQQKAYSDNLSQQVVAKNEKLNCLAREQEFLERLEQIQMAEDLALQREKYLKEKKLASDLYKKALDTQVRFKPLPIPALEPDSSGPIFGVHDATEEKLEERRRRARQLYHEQLDMVSQKKQKAILHDLRNQKEEADMLERTKKDIILDRSIRHQEQLEARHALEKSWADNVSSKKNREEDERLRAVSPGMLIHEQCDKYKRCHQCGRRPHNCGESNVWSESRYIPGSRLIV